MLYFVPTPIGNLDDITLRAIKILNEVDIIYAEDTRTAKNLMKHHDIQYKVIHSFHSFNEHHIISKIISQLELGSNIALISDAGTPGISDPGFLLSRALTDKGIKMTCLPGATAFVPALILSGFPCDRFFFEGFLPHKKGRQTKIKWIAEQFYTIILYESPHRVKKCIQELNQYCHPSRRVAIIREISKIYEEAITLPLSEMKSRVENEELILKGEFVIIVEGKS